MTRMKRFAAALVCVAGLASTATPAAGLGAAGLGAVLLTLPDNPVTRRLDVRMSPEQVSVRRKFGW